MTTGPDAPASEPQPLARMQVEGAGDTDPHFPSAALHAADGAPAGPRPELAWKPPPPPRPTPAPPLDRLAAGIVDAAVVLAILAVVTILASLLLSRGFHWLYRNESGTGGLVGTNVLAIPLLVVLPILAAVAYCVVAPGLLGATVGMRVLGLRLSRDVSGGGAAGVRLAAVRLAFFVAGAAALAAGPLSLLWDPQRRAWHDRASGTVVAHM